jgi:hypothetical protein
MQPAARIVFGQGLSSMKIAQICLPALLLATFSGCITTKDCIDRCCADCRNRCYAEMAWLRCKSTYCDVDCKCDFGKGFRDGYVAVAAGGGMCQPALPPRAYWHFEYQNPTGQAKQLAWFNGYSYGALYAEQEGIADWSRVVTAPTMPAYRKLRPSNTAAAGAAAGSAGTGTGVESVPPYDGGDGSVPQVEPLPPDESAMPPSAGTGIDEFKETHSGGGGASGADIRWTDAANGY